MPNYADATPSVDTDYDRVGHSIRESNITASRST